MTQTLAKYDSATLTDELRRAISAGELSPNQRLVEIDLVEQFGVTRSVVRQALANLAVEGMVERIQNRGARVRSIDLDEALEIVELRAALESLCAANAARTADDAGIARLRGIGTRMQQAVEDDDLEAYSHLNRDLHDAILELSGMRVAPGIVTRLRAQNSRYRIQLARTRNRPRVSLPEHLEIIDAICAREPERAAAAIQAHLRSVAETTREFFA